MKYLVLVVSMLMATSAAAEGWTTAQKTKVTMTCKVKAPSDVPTPTLTKMCECYTRAVTERFTPAEYALWDGTPGPFLDKCVPPKAAAAPTPRAGWSQNAMDTMQASCQTARKHTAPQCQCIVKFITTDMTRAMWDADVKKAGDRDPISLLAAEQSCLN